tara:strand:+ start:1308 stop:2090 length:783 start_codon:yes stop_codon:yes gene_type:complete
MSFKEESKRVNVICIKWGDYYLPEDVNKLFRAVSRNFENHGVDFYCFTDQFKGLDPVIKIRDLPQLKGGKFAYPKEAGLCDDNLGGLAGQRVVYFDLDSVICGSLDRLIYFMDTNEPYITRDYGRDSDEIGGSNLYSWVVGSLGYIKTHYEMNVETVLAEYGSASQEYLSAQIIKKYEKLNFYPNEWHVSFKKHCLRKWPVNFFCEAKKPNAEALLVNFHGDPKIHDAVSGTWSSRVKIPFYKRIYKFTKPTTWVGEHWY